MIQAVQFPGGIPERSRRDIHRGKDAISLHGEVHIPEKRTGSEQVGLTGTTENKYK